MFPYALNKVTPKERQNGETYYLSQITQEISSAKEGDAQKILSRHRRYQELCTMYGQPEAIRSKAQVVDPDSLAARLVRILFKLDSSMQAMELHHEKQSKGFYEPFEIAIPRSCSIYTVLGLVGKHYGLTPMQLKLIRETNEEEDYTDANDEHEYLDEHVDDRSNDGDLSHEKAQRRMRQEELVPRTRTLSAWFENIDFAVVWVERSEIDVLRSKASRA